MIRDRRSLDILSVKKEARLGALSARALAEVQVGRGKEDLRCDSLFIVCQRRLDYQKMKTQGWSNIPWLWNQVVVAVTKRFETGQIMAKEHLNLTEVSR